MFLLSSKIFEIPQYHIADKCFYCDQLFGYGGKFGYGYLKNESSLRKTKDHFYPISRGGFRGLPNMVAACHICNHFKADLTPQEFLHRLAFVHIPKRNRSHFTDEILQHIKKKVEEAIFLIKEPENVKERKNVIHSREAKTLRTGNGIDIIEKRRLEPEPNFHYL